MVSSLSSYDGKANKNYDIKFIRRLFHVIFALIALTICLMISVTIIIFRFNEFKVQADQVQKNYLMVIEQNLKDLLDAEKLIEELRDTISFDTVSVARLAVLNGENVADDNIKPVRSTVIDHFDLLTPTGFTIDDLNSILDNTGFEGYGEYYYEAEELTGINATFLIAVSAVESGWNSSGLAKDKNNIFGWCAYDNDINSAMQFSSKRDCILFVAEALKKLYFSEDGAYYHGNTIAAVSISYCLSNTQWRYLVGEAMCDMYEKVE